MAKPEKEFKRRLGKIAKHVTALREIAGRQEPRDEALMERLDDIGLAAREANLISGAPTVPVKGRKGNKSAVMG